MCSKHVYVLFVYLFFMYASHTSCERHVDLLKKGFVDLNVVADMSNWFQISRDFQYLLFFRKTKTVISSSVYHELVSIKFPLDVHGLPSPRFDIFQNGYISWPKMNKNCLVMVDGFPTSDEFMGLGKNSEKLHRLKTHHHAKSGRFSVSIYAIDDLFA